MSNYSKLYWLTRLDSLSAFIIIISILLLIICLVMVIYSTIIDEDLATEKIIKANISRRTKWMLSLATFLMLIDCFIPTKNEVIFIVAGGKTIDFIQSDSSINKIPAQTTKVVTDFLTKQIKELKDK